MKTFAAIMGLVVYLLFWLASIGFSLFVAYAIFHFVAEYW